MGQRELSTTTGKRSEPIQRQNLRPETEIQASSAA
jgi:hypothetical protein